MKLYERTFGGITWQYTLPANVTRSAGAVSENRLWLPNSTDYTFRERNKRHLTTNNPFSPEENVPLFSENQALKVSMGISYDFGIRYETYPHRRVYLPSKWPKLSINYTKAIAGVFGADADYDLLIARLYKTRVGLGLYGHISFDIMGGALLTDKRVYYTDYRHFTGTRTLISDQRLHTFLLLDYYRHSIPERFMEAHGEYNLSSVFTSKVPLLRNLKLQEIVGLHYLHTTDVDHYGELHLDCNGSVYGSSMHALSVRKLARRRSMLSGLGYGCF